MNNRKLLEKSFFFFGVTLKMEVSDDNSGFDDQLESISTSHKIFYDNLRSVKGGIVNKSLIQKSEEYLKNLDKRAERLKKVYEIFSKQITDYCDNYVNEVNVIEEEDKNEIKELKNDFEKMKDEIEKKKDILNKRSVFEVEEPSFLYDGNVKSKMSVELVKKYPGSYFYEQYMGKDRHRTGDCDIFIDCDGNNDELIVKYMKDDESLVNDMKEMKLVAKGKLLDDLSFLKLPIKKIFVTELGCNKDNEIMEAWRERRVKVIVNNEFREDFIDILQKNQLLDTVYKNQNLGSFQYIEPQKSLKIGIILTFYDVIYDYLKNGKKLNKDLIEDKSDNGDAHELLNEMEMMGIELTDEEMNAIRGCFVPPLFLNISTIIDKRKYDKYLQEWVGDHKWRLLYRASEKDYLAKSFHKYCDKATPTLIIIKSENECIFGGYTTQKWNGSIYYINIIIIIDEWKDDDEAFIFTLKNPHGVKPSKLIKKNDNNRAICCNPCYGPCFGLGGDIGIYDNCNDNGGWTSFGNSAGSYECNSPLKNSLFVNTAKPDETNYFKVSDYEVFTYY